MEVRVGKGFRHPFHTIQDAVLKAGVTSIIVSPGTYSVGLLTIAKTLSLRTEAGAVMDGVIVVNGVRVDLWDMEIRGRVFVESGGFAELRGCTVSEPAEVAVFAGPGAVVQLVNTDVFGMSAHHPAVFCDHQSTVTISQSSVTGGEHSALVAAGSAAVSMTDCALQNGSSRHPTIYASGHASLDIAKSRLSAAASNVLMPLSNRDGIFRRARSPATPTPSPPYTFTVRPAWRWNSARLRPLRRTGW